MISDRHLQGFSRIQGHILFIYNDRNSKDTIGAGNPRTQWIHVDLFLIRGATWQWRTIMTRYNIDTGSGTTLQGGGSTRVFLLGLSAAGSERSWNISQPPGAMIVHVMYTRLHANTGGIQIYHQDPMSQEEL